MEGGGRAVGVRRDLFRPAEKEWEFVAGNGCFETREGLVDQ
jgi:hypothetical protein